MNTYLADTKVYIAGVLMPCIQVTIQSTVNQPPQATIVVPADARLFDVGRNDRVPVHIFQKDVYGVDADDYTRDYLLLFEGQITARTYMSSAFQRAISFQAVGVIAMLDDYRIQYVNQMTDIFQYAKSNMIVDAAAYPGVYSFPECFMLQGLPDRNSKDEADAIEFPYEYIQNVFNYMASGHSNELYKRTAYSVFYSGEAERLKLIREKEEGKRRYLKVPFFDELKEGKEYVWQTKEGEKNVSAVFFPIMAGLKKKITVTELTNAFTGQTQKLSTAMDLIKYMLDPLEFEFAMPASPVYCKTKEAVSSSTSENSSAAEDESRKNAEDAREEAKASQQEKAKEEKPSATPSDKEKKAALDKATEEAGKRNEQLSAASLDKAKKRIADFKKEASEAQGKADGTSGTESLSFKLSMQQSLLAAAQDRFDVSDTAVRLNYAGAAYAANRYILSGHVTKSIDVEARFSAYKESLGRQRAYVEERLADMRDIESQMLKRKEDLGRRWQEVGGISSMLEKWEQEELNKYFEATPPNAKARSAIVQGEADLKKIDAEQQAADSLMQAYKKAKSDNEAKAKKAEQEAKAGQSQAETPKAEQQQAETPKADAEQSQAGAGQSQVGAGQSQEKTKEITSLGTCYLKPILSESIPPQCNVIFRSQVLSISANENFARPVTRVRVPDVGTPMSTLRADGATDEDFLRDATTRFYPQEEGVTEEWLNTPEAFKGMTRNMLEMEKYVGPFVQEVGTPAWWGWCRERIMTCEDEDVEKYMVMQMGLCHRQLLQFRYAQRRLSVSISFDPFIAVGYPAVVFDEADTGLAFAGYVMSVSHNIDNSTQGMTTNIELGYVRLLGEACTMNIIHPVQHLQELYHNPEKMTEIYNRLLGKDIPEEKQEQADDKGGVVSKAIDQATNAVSAVQERIDKSSANRSKDQMPGALAMTFNQIAEKWAFEEGDSGSPQRSVDEAYKLHRRNICTFKQYMDFMGLHYVEEVITGDEPTVVRFGENPSNDDCDDKGNPKPEFLEKCYILRRRPLVYYEKAPKEEEEKKSSEAKGDDSKPAASAEPGSDEWYNNVDKMTDAEKEAKKKELDDALAKKEARIKADKDTSVAQLAEAKANQEHASVLDDKEWYDRSSAEAACNQAAISGYDVMLERARAEHDTKVALLEGRAPKYTEDQIVEMSHRHMAYLGDVRDNANKLEPARADEITKKFNSTIKNIRSQADTALKIHKAATQRAKR